MQCEYPGRFELCDSRQRPTPVLLRRAARRGQPSVEILFAAVTDHELPPTLDGINVRTDSSRLNQFVITSGTSSYRVHARSMQVHEAAQIYGRALPLARFAFGARMLWMLLLWSARFSWGQSLIRRLRAR